MLPLPLTPSLVLFPPSRGGAVSGLNSFGGRLDMGTLFIDVRGRLFFPLPSVDQLFPFCSRVGWTFAPML